MQNARDAHGITGYIGVGGRVQKIDRGGTHKADFWKKRMSEANSAEVSGRERKKTRRSRKSEGERKKEERKSCAKKKETENPSGGPCGRGAEV